MHKLFSLPARWGGLSLPEPSALCDTEFAASLNICEPLCNFIAHRSLHFGKVSSAQLYSKSLIRKSNAEMHSSLYSSLYENFDASLQCAVDLPYAMDGHLLGHLHFVHVDLFFSRPLTIMPKRWTPFTTA